jgi:hypothetical protein
MNDHGKFILPEMYFFQFSVVFIGRGVFHEKSSESKPLEVSIL